MLNLAKKLADCDAKFFGGWVLAGAEAEINGPAVRFENKTLLSKAHKCIIEVYGTTAFGTQMQRLRVWLVLPQGSGKTAAGAAAAPSGSCIWSHVFTVEEVREYVAYTGDRNIIHEGSHPIVPGLCMLARLQRGLGAEKLCWRAAFVSPVHTGDELKVYVNGSGLQAFCGGRLAFYIKTDEKQVQK